MYNAQQLYQFLQYAKQYLDGQEFEYKTGDKFLNPNNEEDLQKLIGIALAEHRTGNNTTDGMAKNTPGDAGTSRGPWQIRGETNWSSVLREYDIFDSFDNLDEALDDPGLNAIAAVIIANYDVGERKGIDNWSTAMDDTFGIQSGTGPFVEAAKNYDAGLVEIPTRTFDAEGNATPIPDEPRADGQTQTQPQPVVNDKLSTKSMRGFLKQAQQGRVFNNQEDYAFKQGRSVGLLSGNNINNQHKKLLEDVNIADLSDAQVVKLYADNIHKYIAYNTTIKGVGMQGDGQNVVDNIKDNVFKKDDTLYDVRTGEIINGNQANARVRGNKTFFYQQFINGKESDPLNQLSSVYRYLFNTTHNFIPVEDAMTTPDTTIRSPGTGFPVNRGQFLEEFNNTRFPKRPGQNLGEGVAQQKAAPTFLNNLEKILRIKKGNVKPGEKPELTNNARDFLGGR